MATESRHVLVVNYDFPPNTGIGGRRWGQLARGMAERGWRVHVVKADPLPDEAQSAWSDAVQHRNIEVHSLPRGYPLILLHRRNRSFPGSLADKIRFRAMLAWVRARYRGTPYDISLGWEPILFPCLQKITQKHPIRWMFATGAPWDMLRVTALYKKLHPERDLRLWVDFRDPWLINQPNYGMVTLSHRKYLEERSKAATILEQADVMSAPDSSILEDFAAVGLPRSERTASVVLSHFYNPQDSKPAPDPSDDRIIKIVYGGTIYTHTGPALQALAADLQLLRERQPAIYDRFRIDFYTDERSTVEGIFGHHPGVRAHAGIGPLIFEEIASASWCIILVADHNKDHCTTKYYDFQPLGTPYLHVGESGAVERRIVAEHRGLAWGTFFAACLAGEVPPRSGFSQTASPADSLDHRIGEIEARIDSIG